MSGGPKWLERPTMLKVIYKLGEGDKDVLARDIYESGVINPIRGYAATVIELYRIENAQLNQYYNGESKKGVELRRLQLVEAGIPIYNEHRDALELDKTCERGEGSSATLRSRRSGNEMFNFHIPKTIRQQAMEYVFSNLKNGKYGPFWLRSNKTLNIYYKVEFDCKATFDHNLWRGDLNDILKVADDWHEQRVQEHWRQLEERTPKERAEYLYNDSYLMGGLTDFDSYWTAKRRRSAVLNIAEQKYKMTPKQEALVNGVYDECILFKKVTQS